MWKEKRPVILIICSLTMAFMAGTLVSYRWGYRQGGRALFPEITTISELNPKISTVEFTGTQAGFLEGKVSGNPARILYGKTGAAEVQVGKTFQIPLTQAATVKKTAAGAQTAATAPLEAAFVASRRGKYYYPAQSKEGQKLSPKNRVFFKDAAEAEAAGFLKK